MEGEVKSLQRIVPVEIDGVVYEMNYSLLATKQLSGEAQAAGMELNKYILDDAELCTRIDRTLHVAELLIAEGARYREYRQGEPGPRISVESMLLVCCEADLGRISECTAAAIVAGKRREVEVEPPKGKNG